VDAYQQRRIELAVAALRLFEVYTEEELAEARERMRRVADDADPQPDRRPTR